MNLSIFMLRERSITRLVLCYREEEGIELQILSSDKKRETQQNENAFSVGSIEFADFNAVGVKEDVPTATSGTIGRFTLY